MMSNGTGLERRRAVATDRVARYERMVEIRAFETGCRDCSPRGWCTAPPTPPRDRRR